ncbi:unnamed protein product [Rhizopus stolonifer]
MLPTHRNMKDGRRDFYNDDKYNKITKKSWFHSQRRNLIISTSILFILFFFYLHNTTTNDTLQAEEHQVKVEPLEPIVPLEPVVPVKPAEPLVPLDILFTQHPPPESLYPTDSLTAHRQQQVVKAFVHAWKGYSQDAFGKDEYQPLTHKGHDWAPGGLGLMMIDALDTIMLMNLTEEYQQVRHWVANDLDFNKDQDVNVFETTIRILGGLLSAYHLSGEDKLYLEKAVDLADRLMPAFDSTTGVPYNGVVLSNGHVATHGEPSSTAEATTLQLEFKYLSHLTGDDKYWKAVEKAMDVVMDLTKDNKNLALDGLVPIFIDPDRGYFPTREVRLGSRGDSYYEYLLKQYLQTNKTEHRYREEYDKAVDGIKKHLIQHSYPSHYTYIAELLDSSNPGNKHPKMDHLVCFMGGSFVLGATEGDTVQGADVKDSEDVRLGEEITRTCYEMYNMTETGLASEIVYFNSGSQIESPDMDIHTRDRHNLLRPEALESIFLLYRMTGDNIYREWGWKIFESFEKHTKLEEGGYSALKDVTSVPARRDNRMDTFFLAETLKYLYLLFSPDDFIPLTHYVLNTEAHPLPVFTPKQ